MAHTDYNVWLDRGHFDDAERVYQEHLSKLKSGGASSCVDRSSCKAAQNSVVAGTSECKLVARVDALEKENREFRKLTDELRSAITSLTNRLAALEKGSGSESKAAAPAQPSPAAKKEEKSEEPADDDDFDLFGSGDEAADEDAERVREERLKAYNEKKANKPVVIAKSNIILDVKPWDDETDMAKLEECVRSIEMDGLLWGASKLVPLAYGIRKLQISCVVEDDKVSTDELEERIVAFEDYIQSMDIAAFNKI